MYAVVAWFGVAGAAEPPPPPPPALSKAPRLIRFVEAPPPSSLAERGRADVVLTIDVDAQGAVTAVEVARSAGPEFDAAAVAAARQFMFEPAEADGHPVPVRITYGYHFVYKPAVQPIPEAPAATVATVPLSGTVKRKGDRLPLPGVAVHVDAGELHTVTDDAGHFAFAEVPVGVHTLRLRSATTAAADTPVTLTPGKSLEVTAYLDSKERYASTVRGQRPVVETVEHTLRTEEIQRIPGTQGDTLKAVQNLPGVARAPFGIGLLSVWGSAPRDTRVYIDGVSIPMLYHFGGLRSTVNGEMVQSLSFVPGGFAADHGLGLGGIIDVETRRPRSDGLHGYAQMDLVDGSMMLEGPLGKRLSFAVAARRSWLDATLPLFTSSQFQLSPIYYDYQARLTWRPTDQDDVNLFFLGSDDKLKLIASSNSAVGTTADSHIYFHRAIASWTRRVRGGTTLSLTSSLGYDVPLQLGLQYGNVPTTIDARSLGYATRAVARVPVASWLRLDGGVDFEGSRFEQARTGVAQPPIGGAAGSGSSGGGFGAGGSGLGGTQSGYASENLLVTGNQVAPFAIANLSLLDKRLTITPQLRLQVMSFVGRPTHLSTEPRLAVRYKLTPRLALKAAVGLYSQPPPSELLSPVFGNPNLGPERGTHYVAGADVDLTARLQLAVAAFYKSLRDLIVPGVDPTAPLLSNGGEGRAYGAEMMLRQELAHNFFGWVSYTFSRSERRDQPGDPWHRYQFDQTHILTVMGSYLLPRGFQVGMRYRHVTGNPYTPVVGAYFDSNADRYAPIAGAPFSARLPSFDQLDARVDKTWTFDRWRLSVYLDVQNALRASNPEAIGYNFDYTVPHPVSGLPLLPIVGVRGDL